MFPLRLCPSASVPSNVMSRCTWPGQGPRTSRTANTMSRGDGVHGHTRSGADDELRTRGLDHGVVALFLLSYIRKGARRTIGQYRGCLAGNLLKNIHRDPVVRSIDRRRAPMRKPFEGENERGPDPCGIRASANRAWRCAPMRSPLPDAPGPRPDQAADSSPAVPDAMRWCNPRTTSSSRHARTRPDRSLVGLF